MRRRHRPSIRPRRGSWYELRHLLVRRQAALRSTRQNLKISTRRDRLRTCCADACGLSRNAGASGEHGILGGIARTTLRSSGIALVPLTRLHRKYPVTPLWDVQYTNGVAS